MKPTVVLKLGPFMYALLIVLGNKVIAALTGNGNFTPFPTLVALQAAVDDVTAAYAVWVPLVGQRGSSAALKDLRAKSRILYQLLQSEAATVQSQAQVAYGNDYPTMAAVLSTSGFELKNARNPQGILQMVQNLHHFVSRQLPLNWTKLKWKRPLNVTSNNNVHDYRIYRNSTPDFATATLIGSTTATSFIDVNTTASLQTWTYWVAAFNNAGLGVPSDPITVNVMHA